MHICMCVLSHVQLFVTPWTVAHWAPLYMGLSRQEYWSGLSFPSPVDFPTQTGIKSMSPAALPLQADSLPIEPPGKKYTGRQYPCAILSHCVRVDLGTLISNRTRSKWSCVKQRLDFFFLMRWWNIASSIFQPRERWEMHHPSCLLLEEGVSQTVLWRGLSNQVLKPPANTHVNLEEGPPDLVNSSWTAALTSSLQPHERILAGTTQPSQSLVLPK